MSNDNQYQSAYSDRLQQTPSLESNRWSEGRGESECAPSSDDARRMLDEKGLSGISYQDGVPDFAPLSESTVKLGYMTDARHSRGLPDGRDSQNTIYADFDDDGEMISSSHRADKESMADLHLKYDQPGNFEQADILTAQQWTADFRDEREWTAEEVAQYREDNGLTWHECNDMETMQMIPEPINRDFGHLGGVGEVKATDRMVDEVLREDDDGRMLEDMQFEWEDDRIEESAEVFTDDLSDPPDSTEETDGADIDCDFSDEEIEPVAEALDDAYVDYADDAETDCDRDALDDSAEMDFVDVSSII